MRILGAIVVSCVLGCSSGGGEYVIVAVHGVPSGADALIGRSALDAQPAESAETFSSPSAGFGGDTSFALRFATTLRGRLSVSVEAWAGGCAVASQSGDVTLAGDELTLDLTLAPITPPDCTGQFQHPPGMVRIAGATFAMGCDAAIDTSCKSDEKPAHMVTLPAYFIDATEASAAAYAACVSHAACPRALFDLLPSTTAQAYLTWDDAAAFCAARGKRLPTEAEWELAARGTDGRIWPWGNDAPTCTHANFEPSTSQQCFQDATGGFVAPIDQGGGASPYGALNMAGNVEEWVADWYGAYPSVALTNPTGPTTGVQRVLRGGSFISSAAEIRTSYRNANAPDASATDLDPQTNSVTFGVRCARTQ